MNDPPKNAVSEKQHQGEQAEQLAAHEFAMLERLKDDHCAPLPLERHGANLRLAMPAGLLLHDWLQDGVVTFEDKLKVAIALSESLAKVHARGIVYRNLSPQHVLINSDFHATWIHFERATRLSRLKQNATQPSQLKGELAYYSPELTGRINRVVDWRSDLYGLGVLLFELFAGQLPFAAETPIEWVNAHLSQHPAPLSTELPPNLTKIIMTLLAKNPEQRYASIQGLVHDLGRLASGERDFALRERDFSETFALPDRLYGREAEVATLERFIEMIHEPLQFVAIAAPSGMGKTALVEELKRSMSLKGALLCSGKFDQFAQNQPFSALGQAIDELARQVMTWETSAYEAWRKRVLKGLNGYGRLLTDISPRLERILGEQPKLPEVDADLAARRVINTFFGFFLHCASAQNPVIFFIDDLQWGDPSTLAILEMLNERRNDLRNILMIHAYRSNELRPQSGYAGWLRAASIATITLQPLDTSAVSAVLRDGFGGRMGASDLGALTQLLFGRSGGSPFFLRELIAALIDHEAIRLDPVAAQWHFDQLAASRIELSGDVAELLLTKFEQLPEATRFGLLLMSFLGRSFSLAQLATCAQLDTIQDAAQMLWPAIELDLVIPLDEGFQMLLTSAAEGSNIKCRFVHDKVQEAARRHLPESEHGGLKHDIALRLLGDQDPLALGREAIMLAELLGDAQLVGKDAAQHRLLHFRAGLFSRQSGQHQIALHFLETAMDFGDAWLPENEQVTLLIADEFADALRANGNIERLESLWRLVDDRIKDKLDGNHVTHALITAYAGAMRTYEAVELYKRFLRSINAGLSDSSSKLGIILAYKKAKRAIGDPKVCFANLQAADAVMTAVQSSLGAVAPALARENPDLFARLICELAYFSVKRGIVPQNYAAIYTIAVVAMALGDIRFGRDLIEAAPSPESCLAEIPDLAMYGYSVTLLWVDPYSQPVSPEALITSQRFVDVAYRLGDLERAANFFGSDFVALLSTGQSLATLRDHLAHDRSEYDFSKVPVFEVIRQGLLPLASMSVAGDVSAFELGRFSDPLMKATLSIMSIFIHALFGESVPCATQIAWRESEAGLAGVLLCDVASCYYEIGIIRYGAPPLPTLKGKMADFVKRKMFQARMKHLRGFGSDILDALTGLVLANQAEKRGASTRAQTLYEEAYWAAERYGSAREQLMAAEYSYRLLRSSNHESALVWLQRTLVAADEYSFMPKTVALKEEFAEDIKALQVLFPQLRGTANSEAKASDDLDLATLIQAGADLAEAKDLNALVAKALEIVVKNLSATRAQLWQHADGSWNRLGGEGEFSTAFLDEIYRAQEVRVIDNAADAEYELKCQSALCLPMASGGQSIGLMVIENDTLTEAFPRSRLPFLKTLGNQIATAIANALLYAQMEEKVQEKARAMVAIMTHIEQGILTIEASGKIADDYSSALPQILGLTQIAGRDALEILFGQAELAPDVVDQVGATLFASLGEDVLNFEVNAERLISEFSLRSGKIIEVDWVPIVDDFDEVRSIMVTLRDVTQVRASQAAAEASAMELKRIGSLLALSPRQASDFFDDARTRLEASKARVEQSTDPSDWLELNFRDLHTLKGVSRSYQFLDLAAMIHEVEEPYQTARQSADSALPDTAALSVALAELLDLISDYERIEHEVLKRQGASSLNLAGLRAAAASRDWQAVDELLAEGQSLDLEGLLAPVIRSLPTLAKDLGRPEPQLIFDLQTTTIDPSWGTTLLGALTHVLRNSVDHGLKTAATGEIHLAVAETPDHVRITIEDAGRGLNLGALEQKLGGDSDEDLAAAIFRSGLSTNDNISDISGRGVGMDAMRAAIEERGGRVMVEFVSAARDAEGYRKHRLVMLLPKGVEGIAA